MNGKLAEHSANTEQNWQYQNWQYHLCDGLEKLAQAYRYAYDTDSSIWDFAVELETLIKIGLNYNDLRWLLLKDYIEHALERTSRNHQHREYESACDSRFHENSCFVLSDLGYDFNTKMKTAVLASRSTVVSQVNGFNPVDQSETEPQVQAVYYANPEPSPAWYAETHEFYVGTKLVKEFKLPSANQETILTAFQEEGWPKRIDDPLPPGHGVDPRRRLHDTIRGLNRNQKVKMIRFMADGTGEGIRWKLRADE